MEYPVASFRGTFWAWTWISRRTSSSSETLEGAMKYGEIDNMCVSERIAGFDTKNEIITVVFVKEHPIVKLIPGEHVRSYGRLFRRLFWRKFYVNQAEWRCQSVMQTCGITERLCAGSVTYSYPTFRFGSRVKLTPIDSAFFLISRDKNQLCNRSTFPFSAIGYCPNWV